MRLSDRAVAIAVAAIAAAAYIGAGIGLTTDYDYYGRLASALVQVISGEVVPATWSSPGTGSGFTVVLGLPAPAGA